MTRTLVTGAAGFIGSHLVDRLLADGHEVIGVDSFSDYYARERKEANLVGARRDAHFELLEADLSDLVDDGSAIACLHGALSDCDVVFHLAAQPGVRSSWAAGFRAYMEANILVTGALMSAAESASVPRVVYASSSSVYGHSASLPMCEDQPCAPVSPYGYTKLGAERAVAAFGERTGAVTAVLRFFTVFGPRQRPDMAFQRAIESACRGEPFHMFGDGTQTRDFTYVDDVVDAIVRSLDTNESLLANVGGGANVTLREALESIGEVLGTSLQIAEEPAARGDVHDTLAATELAHDVLGWSPSISLAEGIKRQAAFSADLLCDCPSRNDFDADIDVTWEAVESETD